MTFSKPTFSNEVKEKWLSYLEKFGQKDLFRFYDELDEKQRAHLIDEIGCVDFPLMKDLYSIVKAHTGGALNNSDSKSSIIDEISPLPCTDATSMDPAEKKRLYGIGLEQIAQGKMAALTMAGGQGTRLGHTGPKGTYDIGLPSHKSLFEIQCCGLKKVSEEAGRIVPWYIMTSHINHADTVEFFKQNDYFGYGEENVVFFPQTVVPAMDKSGKLLLGDKCSILKSPNGNGGLFASLANFGGFDRMKASGITSIFICGIDNCLVKMADPLFMGFYKDCGCKAVAKSFIKRTADEKAGVICRRNGKPYVIEYTEIPEELAELKDDNGVWVYGDTNVLNYIFDIDTAEKLGNAGLPYHLAVKKLSFIDFETGEMITIPDGYKFELFLFDAFANLDDLGVLRIERTEEFAPVKNATGVDSAESAREMYMKIHKEEAEL